MSVILNMACGLANRMFQYAYYQYLLDRGLDVKVDYFTHNKLAHENVEWNRIFPGATFRQASAFEVFRYGGGSSLFSKIRRRYIGWSTKTLEMSGAFGLYEPNTKEDIYLIGVFQSASPAQSVADLLKDKFKFAEFTDERNLNYKKKIESTNSVAIHVRKGVDYQKIKWYQNTCDVEYYNNAVDYIKSHVDNPRFFVFTDNPDWVAENLKGIDYELIEGNPVSGWGSHFDMQLMSLCKHNIVSNSTYSWWGAFLNADKGKIVVCPDIWFNPQAVEKYKSTPLLCDGWVTI